MVAKSWTQLSDFTVTFHFHALEKEMATHSSVLAWRIPGTAEHGFCISFKYLILIESKILNVGLKFASKVKCKVKVKSKKGRQGLYCGEP